MVRVQSFHQASLAMISMRKFYFIYQAFVDNPNKPFRFRFGNDLAWIRQASILYTIRNKVLRIILLSRVFIN